MSFASRFSSRLLLVAGIGCMLIAQAATDGTTPIEEEPVVDAASLVRPALLSGPDFTVDPHVELRGYMAHFTLDTKAGPLNADSIELLAERVSELPALDALDEATRSKAFADAAGTKLAATGKSLANIAMHPVDTVLGIPAGVARYFGNRLKKIGTQAQTISDRAAKTFGQNGNPYPSDEGPMTDASAGVCCL